MDKFRCEFFKKSWVRKAQGFKYFFKIHLSQGFFLDVGVLMNLKNEEVLLSGIGRGNEFFFF